MAFTFNLAKNLPYPLFGIGSLVRKISLCATKSNPEVLKAFLKTCLRSASTVAPLTTAEETDNLVVDDWIEIADADRSKFKPLNEQIYTKDSYLKYFSDYLNETETTLPSPVAFKMIKACGSQMSAEDEKTRNELALYAWEQLKKNGTPLGISMWNTLLSVFIENQHQFDPVYFLHQLRQETSLEPNQSTLSLLIQKYAIDGDTAGVMKIIEFMMEKNFAMTENKYAWLIQAFAKNGNFKGVENVLESMRENGIPPRHTTYKQIINAHARNGDLHSIDQTIKEMLSEKISPTAEMYADLLENLCLGGHLSLLETTLNRITDIETMQRRLRTLLQQCTLRGDYESAVVLVQFYMRQRKNRKFQFLHACGIALFNNLSHTNKGLEEFVKLSNTFERSLGAAENSRVAFLAEYCASNGKLGWAFELADKHATENEQKVYHQILKVLTFMKDSASIAKIFCHMMERNISPDYYCSRYVTQSLEKANNEELIRFLDNLKELENFEIHHNFINALLENEDITLSDLAKYIHLSINGNIVGSIKPITELIQRDFNDAEAFKIIKVLENKKINTEKMIERIMQTNTLIDADTTKKAYNLMVNVMQEGIATSKFSHFYMLKGLYTFLRIQEPQYFFSFVQIMKDHNIEPDVSQQILMLRMASKIGNPQAAEFCFDRIIISEELPAFYKENKQMLYQYLIESYQNEAFLNAKSKRSPNASRIIDISKDMQSKGISPCNRAVNAIAISHLIKNDVETAQKLIDETEGFKQNVRDRNSLNTALITTYIGQGNYDAAEEKFSQLKNDDIVTFGQYKQMFRMCEFKENVLRMEELYEDLISREMKADAFIDEHMIRTYLKNYQAELCVGILERNVQQTRTKMTVDVFMTVIGELVLKPQNMQLLQTAIDITRENFPEVEERRFNEALLIANINTGSFQQAHQYYTNIVEERVEVESEDGEMKKSPNPLNTFKKFASMAARQGNLEIIGKIVMFLKEFNLPPHLVDTPYLEALGKHEEVEKIKSLLEERSNNKVEESKSFSAVLCDLQQKLPV